MAAGGVDRGHKRELSSRGEPGSAALLGGVSSVPPMETSVQGGP